jgi:hypothetical protein
MLLPVLLYSALSTAFQTSVLKSILRTNDRRVSVHTRIEFQADRTRQRFVD